MGWWSSLSDEDKRLQLILWSLEDSYWTIGTGDFYFNGEDW